MRLGSRQAVLLALAKTSVFQLRMMKLRFIINSNLVKALDFRASKKEFLKKETCPLLGHQATAYSFP
jgi:hypothetical protein